MANSDTETAKSKIRQRRLPHSSFLIHLKNKEIYEHLVKNCNYMSNPSRTSCYFNKLQELGMKPAAFISTISNERGQELLYTRMRISDEFNDDIGLEGLSVFFGSSAVRSLPSIRLCTYSSLYRFATLGYCQGSSRWSLCLPHTRLCQSDA
jgi:hypothetical protein